MKCLSVRLHVAFVVSVLVGGFVVSSNAQLSFSNPLLDFDSILCVARDIHPTEQHICDQYFGCFAVPKGSIYIISDFKGNQRKVTDLVENSTVKNGRYAGKKLVGGSFISPDLSYDGKTVVFGWKPASTTYQPSWDQDQCFHLFKVEIDGSNLTQLTDGKWNDFDPCWLPNGRIVFISERRGGYGRCHGRPVPTYTLHSMKDDGSDIIILSYHETNEWQPSVDNNGMIVYSRWDYIDRDDCIAHHPWICYPDGRDPRSWHGNYPLSLSTMDDVRMEGVGKGGDGKWPDGRNFRPWSEVNVRAIPKSNKYVATATGHHTQSFGDLIIIDQSIRDDGKMSQIKGITTNKTIWPDAAGPWATAWPLSEEYFLASYNGDIVMIDKSANHLMVCPKSATPASSLNGFKLLDPIPIKARSKPPAIAVQTYEGEREKLEHEPARLSVMNVNETDIPFPEGTKIKWLRVIQLIPKATIKINEPRVSAASESVCRMALGVVPVESDGSAHFEAPVDRCLMFQALDSNFMAVQSMRSLTYVHKGEHLTCIGCHEDKWKATPTLNPIAMSRAPSKLVPEFTEALPTSYYRTAKPVFDAKCVSCHKQKAKGPDMSYSSLKPYIFHFCDEGWPYTNGNISSGEVGGSRTIPGKFGARRSKLYSHLLPSHQNVNLTKDEIHRVVIWLDMNSNELGSEGNVSAQQRGELVWPTIDVDPKNPLGLENPSSANEPVSATVSPANALVKPGASTQFKAVGVDAMGTKTDNQPTFTWSVSGGGTISTSGLFSAASGEGGSYTVTAEATIGGSVKQFTATVTISSTKAAPLPSGNMTKLLCITNGCIAGGDTSAIQTRFAGEGKDLPIADIGFTVNGKEYQWTEQSSQNGEWFVSCGSNTANYASFTIVNSSERKFKIGYVVDDQLTVWMNGVRVFYEGEWSSEERFSPTITMPSGHVAFLVKHVNDGNTGNFSMRLVDDAGKDVNDLLYYLGQLQSVANHNPANGGIHSVSSPYTISTAAHGLKVTGACKQMHRVEVFNARGQRIAFIKGTGNLNCILPVQQITCGMLFVRIEIDNNKYGQAIALTRN
ncbi:MAG TPA: hypothetical protein VHO70_09740 [Chitinispirillaceae bacterium]|nr:hypothetical protein [Chitinispirillaceae bacterium]